MERLCRVYKYAMRTTLTQFAPLLEPLVKLLCKNFHAYPRS